MQISKQTELGLICLLFMSTSGHASEFNLDFLKGAQTVPSILNSAVKFPRGFYSLDVFVNSHYLGQHLLNISEIDEKRKELCFDQQWLERAGIHFLPERYQDHLDKEKACYVLGDEEHTLVAFNPSMQQLRFYIPQAYLITDDSAQDWDYGVSGYKLKYNGNFNVSSESDVNAFGQIDSSVNWKRWRLDANVNASQSEQGSAVSTNQLVLTTALRDLHADLSFGRSVTDLNLFSDFGFYGLSLRSNEAMTPFGTKGYAPTITGVADSTSRITISQNGYTIYSRVVPPGPYELDDITTVGNGDITVVVKANHGTETTTTYPVATLPTLLRADESKFNFVVGTKVLSSDLSDAFLSDDGTFALGSVDHGFKRYTLSGSAIVHEKYQSLAAGITHSFGEFGALSFDVAAAKARFDDGTQTDGVAFGAKYGKSFSNDFDIHLAAYRFQTEGYIEFADFDASENDQDELLMSQKSRYELRMSQQWDGYSLRGTFWYQDYWQEEADEQGVNFALGTQWRDTSIYVNAAYTDSMKRSDPDYSLSIGVSIPFDLYNQRHHSFNILSYTQDEGVSLNSGVSATVNERVNYNINTNVNEHRSSLSGTLGYKFDAVQTSVSLTQSESTTSLSGGVSGMILGTSETGLIMTSDVSDATAIVKLDQVEGARFNDSNPTNASGVTVVRLTDYNKNDIAVDVNSIDENITLHSSTQNVIPTEDALIYREFSSAKIQRFILRARDAKGNVLRSGNVRNAEGQYVGFVGDNGVLIVELTNDSSSLRVTQENDICRINMKTLDKDSNHLQEVTCD